jgi:CheY-like chemotaxis protein
MPLTVMSKRILVADDSDTVRRAVHSYLTGRDFEVCGEAVDGEDAVEKARKLKPDLILLDVAMPRTNGIETAHSLAKRFLWMRLLLKGTACPDWLSVCKVCCVCRYVWCCDDF